MEIESLPLEIESLVCFSLIRFRKSTPENPEPIKKTHLFSSYFLEHFWYQNLYRSGFNQRNRASRRYILKDLLQLIDLNDCGSWLEV